MNTKQTSAILDAYLDLIGAFEDTYGQPHDWTGHLLTIKKMSEVFKEELREADLDIDYFDDVIRGNVKRYRSQELAQEDILSN
jgi:hypothetical protein